MSDKKICEFPGWLRISGEEAHDYVALYQIDDDTFEIRYDENVRKVPATNRPDRAAERVPVVDPKRVNRGEAMDWVKAKLAHAFKNSDREWDI